MAGKLVVSITNAKNDADRATVGFVVANAVIASGQVVAVTSHDPGAAADIPAWCRMRRHDLLGVEPLPAAPGSQTRPSRYYIRAGQDLR